MLGLDNKFYSANFSNFYKLTSYEFKYLNLMWNSINDYYFIIAEDIQNLPWKLAYVKKSDFTKTYIWEFDDYRIVNTILLDLQYDKFDQTTRTTNFNIIKQTYQDITKNYPTYEAKKKALYDWVISNVVYDNDLFNYETKWQISNTPVSELKKWHSWLATILTKKAVCDGYSNLFIYFLFFLDKEYLFDIDLETKIWLPLNWLILHAWVRHGNEFYDPTYDRNNKKVKNYYMVPEDIMNADRKPDVLTADININIESANEIIFQNYYNLAWKYWNSYPILSYYVVLNKYWINKSWNYTIDDVKKFFKDYIEVENIGEIMQLKPNGTAFTSIQDDKKGIDYFFLKIKDESNNSTSLSYSDKTLYYDRQNRNYNYIVN